jgi:uncharacterized protein (TIGR00369 family)
MDELREHFNDLWALRAIRATIERLEPGQADVSLDPPTESLNPNGAVNGGVIAAAMDMTGGFAVASSGPDTEYSSTVDLAIHFMAPARALPLTLRSRVLRRGRRMCFVGVEVTDAEGKSCATATGSWALMPGSPHARGT